MYIVRLITNAEQISIKRMLFLCLFSIFLEEISLRTEMYSNAIYTISNDAHKYYQNLSFIFTLS